MSPAGGPRPPDAPALPASSARPPRPHRGLVCLVRAATSADVSMQLTEAELDMTVEEYLRAQCERRVDQLKRHMEGLIESFDGEAKKCCR